MTGVTEFLSRNRDRILDSWLTESQRRASSRGLSKPELRNLLPKYLPALGVDGEVPDSFRSLLANHLAGRIRQGFDLSEMVEEFVLLESVLDDISASLPADERLPEAERRAVGSAVQRTIVLVTALFNDYMQLDEQREKRYLRLLEQVADQALRTPDEPLAARLGEVVALILEGTGADTASLLLYEHDSDRLFTVASAGVAAKELEKLTTSLSRGSVTGQVAARVEPTEIADVETTELEVNEELRHSGIHSLLGIRLPPRFKLLGILYVGLKEKRPFTPREMQRLEAFADRLTLHLDNAKLYGDLRRNIEELAVERELRERFVAVLAHDLRGPLSNAKLGAQLLAERPDSLDERRELAVRIERNLDRLDRMIRTLLDVTRVRAGERLPLRLDRCDLGNVAREVAEDCAATYGDRLDLEAEHGVRGIWSAEELRRAVWNLCANALKYGAPDGRVTVRVERTPEGARVSVHNVGHPIPREERARLFDVYERLRASVEPGGGWGLGLALVRACADAHGGTISVESTPEAGTTFTLDLPLDSRPYADRGDGAPA